MGACGLVPPLQQLAVGPIAAPAKDPTIQGAQAEPARHIPSRRCRSSKRPICSPPNQVSRQMHDANLLGRKIRSSANWQRSFQYGPAGQVRKPKVGRDLNYKDRLVLVAFRLTEGTGQPADTLTGDRLALDPKVLALARLAALIATGGPVPSYSELVDAAVNEGATPADAVDVLESIVDVVGSARVVDAAPKLAMALGFDINQALEANGEH